jgi:hypothetical protein
MATSIKKMNRALYDASFHLLEASKHLSNEEMEPAVVGIKLSLMGTQSDPGRWLK